MCEDPVVYTHLECKNLLKRIDEGNKSTGGLTEVTKAYGIIGLYTFLSEFVHIYNEQSIYMLLVYLLFCFVIGDCRQDIPKHMWKVTFAFSLFV